MTLEGELHKQALNLLYDALDVLKQYYDVNYEGTGGNAAMRAGQEIEEYLDRVYPERDFPL